MRKLGVGGGIGLWHNGMRGLQQLGVAKKVESIGLPMELEEFWTDKGEVLAEWPVGEIGERLGAPSIGALRAELQPLLVAELDAGSVHMNARCIGFTQHAAGVRAHLADGGEEHGDLLIAADGHGSTLRSEVAGEAKIRYAGYAAWQGLVDFSHDAVAPGGMRHVWGPGARFSFYHVAPGRIYWFAYGNDAEGALPAADGWKPELLDRYAGWPAPTTAMIDATDEDAIRRVDIYDRAMATPWSVGRIALLGDAAHPMQPNLGQGACQAIEDAVVLGKCLAAEANVVEALQLYEARRRKRARHFHSLARQIGALGRWESPLACRLRTAVLKPTLRRIVLRRYANEMGYEF